MIVFVQVNGKYIEWGHIVQLYERLSTTYIQSFGLSVLPKLKLEHVKLTGFSRMRVDLAAQVQATYYVYC